MRAPSLHCLPAAALLLLATGSVSCGEGASQDDAASNDAVTITDSGAGDRATSSDAAVATDVSTARDSAPPSDATSPDRARQDLGSVDQSATDRSTPEHSAPDHSVADQNSPDSGAPDTSAPDTSAPDGGAPDQNGPDHALPDQGTPDKAIPDAAGGTVITGTLSGHLTAAGSPYRVVGDAEHLVTLPSGSTLTVDPGVVVDFLGDPALTASDVSPHNLDDVTSHQAGRIEFRVYGHIAVSGSAEQMVTFTSTNPWGWWGINFYGDESVGDGHPVFDHLVFEKARKNRYNSERRWFRAAMWAYYPGGPVTITNSVFRDNEASAKCGALDLMYTDGSLVANNLFEDNRTYEIDQFGEAGSSSYSGGGAMCVTHGVNSIIRDNTFRNNGIETYRLSQYNEPDPGLLIRRPILEWPNDEGRYDLGGGGVIHYFQPGNDLLEGNLFEGNFVADGPAAVIYAEDIDTRGLTLRSNRFEGNRATAGGVIVCNRGRNTDQIVVTADNVFVDNTIDGAPAPEVTGDCTVATE